MAVGPAHHHDVSHLATLPADRLSVMGVAWTLARPSLQPLSALAPAGAWVVDLNDARAPHGERLAAGVRLEEVSRAGRLTASAATRWLRSRFALRDILGACLDRDPLAVELSAGPSGKLAVTGAPRVDFSVAHSCARALVGVSLAGAVGVDVEWVRPGLHEVAIARRVMGDAAGESLARTERSERTARFFAAWVRHEAALKCRGRRLVDALGYDATAGLAVRDLEVGEGYAAAWAGTEVLVADTVITRPYDWPAGTQS